MKNHRMTLTNDEKLNLLIEHLPLEIGEREAANRSYHVQQKHFLYQEVLHLDR